MAELKGAEIKTEMFVSCWAKDTGVKKLIR